MQRMGMRRFIAARARPNPSPTTRPAARDGDHTVEPSVGDGHHLHPDGSWLRLSGRDARLVQPPVLSWRLSITMAAAFCVQTLALGTAARTAAAARAASMCRNKLGCAGG
jgi:hypothetical protein